MYDGYLLSNVKGVFFYLLLIYTYFYDQFMIRTDQLFNSNIQVFALFPVQLDKYIMHQQCVDTICISSK